MPMPSAGTAGPRPVIRALPDAVINRIAAGEVVERPASVVKELVENALDAGARQVVVQIEGGGKSAITVRDDGIGMTGADLALAVCRHATSKLAGDDLVAIRTLGFRGEALPSIGAVARLAITSRARGTALAHRIEVAGGAVRGPMPAALGEGTVVSVEELFFCVPARLKFLKSDQAETAAVAVAMMCLVLIAGPRLGARAQIVLTVGAVLATLAVAAIRVAVGAHFPSDVVGSIVLMAALVPALHSLFGLGRLSRPEAVRRDVPPTGADRVT